MDNPNSTEWWIERYNKACAERDEARKRLVEIEAERIGLIPPPQMTAFLVVIQQPDWCFKVQLHPEMRIILEGSRIPSWEEIFNIYMDAVKEGK